jgi:hypothetical protein
MTEVSTNRYYCPAWCEGHDEDSMELTETEQRAVHCSGVGGDYLLKLTNAHSGRLLRDERMSYEVSCNMTELANGTRLGDFVHLDVTDLGDTDHVGITMRLTPAEARTLAAILIAGADRLDVVRPTARDEFHRFGSRAEQ